MKKFTSISTTTLALILMAGLVTNGAAEKPICTDLNDQRYPTISGNLILWTDIRKGKWNTYMYDLSTGNKNRITSDLNSQCYPAISGHRIVWADVRNGNWDIYMYDLATATETPICTHPSLQRHPAISGDRIVWEGYRDGNGDIYMYDLSLAPVLCPPASPSNSY